MLQFTYRRLGRRPSSQQTGLDPGLCPKWPVIKGALFGDNEIYECKVMGSLALKKVHQPRRGECVDEVQARIGLLGQAPPDRSTKQRTSFDVIQRRSVVEVNLLALASASKAQVEVRRSGLERSAGSST